MLADGGNAIDAVVAAALAACVAAPHSVGIGGYGMSAVIAFEGGRRLIAIDGNTTAPAAMRADMFRPDAKGKLPRGFSQADPYDSTGWLFAGVPGIPAGLQLALDRCGTRGFGELARPAIALARDGFPWPQDLADVLQAGRARFERDPGTRALFLPQGRPVAAGELFKNPDLAAMLARLAEANSVEAFYRGDIADLIAEGFRKNGGLVTRKDLASYRARPVEPLTMTLGGAAIHTAPLTAGGLTVLQMLATLRAMKWEKMPAGLPRTHARAEAMRIAWRDRSALLGDPDFVEVPTARLLSEDYARESAERVLAAVKDGRMFLAHEAAPRAQAGTIHLSAADRQGNFASLTLTHGNNFGARVTVPGLGLTLGHGMSRFDPDPAHPNAPGPGKRPLHNLCPTIVTRDGRAVLAVGGSGGRMIPNGLLEVLIQGLMFDQPLAAAIAALRLHTEGAPALSLEKAWPADEAEALRGLGYSVDFAASAHMNGVALENGGLRKARR